METSPKEPKKKQFSCKICKKTFANKEYLKKHAKVHPGELFLCQVCGKMYSNPRTYILHKQKHSGDIVDRCPLCGLTLKRKKYLLKHLEKCKLRKRWKCVQCQKYFANKFNLDRHVAAHKISNTAIGETGIAKTVNNKTGTHSTGTRKCVVCGKCGIEFPAAINLMIHLKNVHRPNHVNNILTNNRKSRNSPVKQGPSQQKSSPKSSPEKKRTLKPSQGRVIKIRKIRKEKLSQVSEIKTNLVKDVKNNSTSPSCPNEASIIDKLGLTKTPKLCLRKIDFGRTANNENDRTDKCDGNNVIGVKQKEKELKDFHKEVNSHGNIFDVLLGGRSSKSGQKETNIDEEAGQLQTKNSSKLEGPNPSTNCSKISNDESLFGKSKKFSNCDFKKKNGLKTPNFDLSCFRTKLISHNGDSTKRTDSEESSETSVSKNNSLKRQIDSNMFKIDSKLSKLGKIFGQMGKSKMVLTPKEEPMETGNQAPNDEEKFMEQRVPPLHGTRNLFDDILRGGVYDMKSSVSNKGDLNIEPTCTFKNSSPIKLPHVAKQEESVLVKSDENVQIADSVCVNNKTITETPFETKPLSQVPENCFKSLIQRNLFEDMLDDSDMGQPLKSEGGSNMDGKPASSVPKEIQTRETSCIAKDKNLDSEKSYELSDDKSLFEPNNNMNSLKQTSSPALATSPNGQALDSDSTGGTLLLIGGAIDTGDTGSTSSPIGGGTDTANTGGTISPIRQATNIDDTGDGGCKDITSPSEKLTTDSDNLNKDLCERTVMNNGSDKNEMELEKNVVADEDNVCDQDNEMFDDFRTDLCLSVNDMLDQDGDSSNHGNLVCDSLNHGNQECDSHNHNNHSKHDSCDSDMINQINTDHDKPDVLKSNHTISAKSDNCLTLEKSEVCQSPRRPNKVVENLKNLQKQYMETLQKLPRTHQCKEINNHDSDSKVKVMSSDENPEKVENVKDVNENPGTQKVKSNEQVVVSLRVNNCSTSVDLISSVSEEEETNCCHGNSKERIRNHGDDNDGQINSKSTRNDIPPSAIDCGHDPLSSLQINSKRLDHRLTDNDLAHGKLVQNEVRKIKAKRYNGLLPGKCRSKPQNGLCSETSTSRRICIVGKKLYLVRPGQTVAMVRPNSESTFLKSTSSKKQENTMSLEYTKKTLSTGTPGLYQPFKGPVRTLRSQTRHAQSDRLFCCDICDKSFKSKSSLRTHKFSHTQYNFVCQTCGRGFFWEDHLERHMSVHLNSSMYIDLLQSYTTNNG